MKNKGLQSGRLKREPIERLFAAEWEKLNTNRSNHQLDGKGTLDYILAKDPNDPCGEVSDRDREVAATVIQWLGSPCGQSFIRDSLRSDVLINRTEVLRLVRTAVINLKEHKGHAWLADDDIDNNVYQPLLTIQNMLSKTTEEYLSEKSW